MTIENAVNAAGAGTLTAVPRGVRHTFNHRRDGTARVLNVHAPERGFADVLRRIAE
jgi:mannose-6-phosphate isomerase-like protein (cupin superfamily)